MWKIASWNINSIKVRQERVLAFLEREKPDVLCLQELKCVDDAFPADVFKKAGYHSAVFGQKTYNGVAILSKKAAGNINRGFDDAGDDPQARAISAEIDGVQVVNVYVPNGQEIGTDKFTYKLEWLRRLQRFLVTNYKVSTPLVVCGDFNIAPDVRDVHDPDLWQKIHFSPPEQDAMKKLLSFGFHDTLRLRTQDPGIYSWWDYRQLAFPMNQGLRIDLILCSEPLKSQCSEVRIDREERKGEQPSDHAPVIAVFNR